MATTDQDRLHDACIAAATALCIDMCLRHGIDQIAEAMTQAGMAEAIEIRDAQTNERQSDMLREPA